MASKIPSKCAVTSSLQLVLPSRLHVVQQPKLWPTVDKHMPIKQLPATQLGACLPGKSFFLTVSSLGLLHFPDIQPGETLKSCLMFYPASSSVVSQAGFLCTSAIVLEREDLFYYFALLS